MFFSKKKEELSDQLAVYQKRKDPRYWLDAGITIEGFEGEGQVGNVSNSGCYLASVTYVAFLPDKTYQAKITPGPEDAIKPFSLELKLNWTKSSETLFEAGLSLEDKQDNNQLKRYVELLRIRGVPPDYGNMDIDDGTFES
jgi:hypothetical protein